MAITWGATSGYFRLGIDIKVSGTRATVIVYGQSVGYGHNWTYPLNLTGSWSGSRNVSFYSATGQTVTKQLYSASYSFTGRRTYGANISYWNGSASVSRSVTISPPSKPQPPAAPGLSKISRSSDTKHVLSWSHSGGATGFSIERRDYEDGAWGAWRIVGAANSTSARSYTDTGTVAGRAYQWRVRARNSVGFSPYSGASLVTPTTPISVPNVSAKRAGGGVRVTWSAVNSSPSNVSWQVMHDVKDGASTQLADSQPGDTREYVHTSPDATRVQSYRVRQTVHTPHDGGATLYGPWGESNPVQLISKPATPTILLPQEGRVYAPGSMQLKWAHNATDGSEQTQADIEIRRGSTLIFRTTINGADKEYLWTPPDVGDYFIAVQTRGSHPDWSGWSASTRFTIAHRPEVTVLLPDEVVTTNTTYVKWDVSQAQGYTQNAFRVTLYTGDGVELGQWQDSNYINWFRLPYTLENNTNYTLVVEVATNDLWSLPVEHSFRVEYEQPATPVIDAAWDDDMGAVTVYVDVGSTDEPVPPTKRINLYRSTDSGETWELLVEDFEPGSALSDFTSPSNGEVLYKAVAFTEIGGTAESLFMLEADSDKLWIGAGPGYTQTLGIAYNPEASGSVEADRASLVFDGRTLPVPVLGAARGQSMKLSGWLLDGEKPTLDDLVGLVQADFVTHLVRIPGRSMYGIITSMDWDYKRGGAWPVSFTIRETEPEAS